MDIVVILIIAIIIDLVFGDPPNKFHPVAWLGKLISFGMQSSPRQGNVKQLIFGIIIVIVTITTITLSSHLMIGYLKETNTLLYIVLSALILKFTFSFRGLRHAAISIKNLLERDELIKARFSLKSLVSRDTTTLNKSQMIAATVESVSENSCDSFIAPLFYFLIFGVPGAIAYRVINTFDAMIGYHGDFEYSGKFAARLDDIANFIPARLAALLIIISAWISRNSTSQAWHIMLRDHSKTQSPNAGWTMSAIAGALEVQLEKTGYYVLGNNQRTLSTKTIEASLRIITITALIWSLLIILLAEVIHYATA